MQASIDSVLKEIFEIQDRFCGLIRTKNGNDPFVKTYQKLIFNVHKSALENSYPLTKKMLSNEHWEDLACLFVQYHNSNSEKIWETTKDLLRIALEFKLPEKYKLPFLIDLIKFEWVEIQLFMNEDNHIDRAKETSSEPTFLALNQTTSILDLNYPVYDQSFFSESINRIQNNLPINFQPQQHFILCYRHPVKLNVHYLKLEPLVVITLDLLSKGVTRETAVNQITNNYKLIENSFDLTLNAKIEALINQLIALGIILI